MKCICSKVRISSCGDCGKREFLFDRDELEDIHSALAYFVKIHKKDKGAVVTSRAMHHIVIKIIKMKKDARLEDEE